PGTLAIKLTARSSPEVYAGHSGPHFRRFPSISVRWLTGEFAPDGGTAFWSDPVAAPGSRLGSEQPPSLQLFDGSSDVAVVLASDACASKDHGQGAGALRIEAF